LKIKAQPSDLEWLCIVTERRRGEANLAKGFILVLQADTHAAWQGIMCYIVINMKSSCIIL